MHMALVLSLYQHGMAVYQHGMALYQHGMALYQHGMALSQHQSPNLATTFMRVLDLETSAGVSS